MIEEERLVELETRVSDLAEEVEKIKTKCECPSGPSFNTRKSRSRGELFMGLLLIGAGTIWLGNSLAWFSLHIPFWPAILILIGLSIVINSRR